MAESMATGWHYLKTGAPADQQMGPLTWEQLYGLRTSGSMQPTDLVWHPTMSGWLPASQVPGLLGAATQASSYQQAPYQQPTAQHQPSGYQQPTPYWQAAQPGWAMQGGYEQMARPRSSGAAWLIALAVIVIVGAAAGTYFGFFHNKGEWVSASDIAGLWEGTVTYTDLDIDDLDPEDQVLRDQLLDQEIPATLELIAGAGWGDASRLVRAAAEDGTVSGTAVLTLDFTFIDPSYGAVTNDMTFTYSEGKLVFEPDEPGAGVGSITAEVKKKDGRLEMTGEMTFDDELGSGRATWNVSKESTVTPGGGGTGTTGGGPGGTSGGPGGTGTTGGGAGAIASADLNGSWSGTLTVTGYSGDPWAARGLTGEVVGQVVNIPIPATMNIDVDESGTGTGRMVVGSTTVGLSFDIGTSNMPLTVSRTTLTFEPDPWAGGTPTMTAEVSEVSGGLRIKGTFTYDDGSNSFEARYELTQ